jgi:hypothetical protein
MDTSSPKGVSGKGGTGPGSVRSASELALRVAADPELAEQIKQNPAEVIARVAAPLQTDVWIYRMVVGALGLTVLLAIIGSVGLVALGRQTPEAVVALGSAAVGALAGLLAPSPSSKS